MAMEDDGTEKHSSDSFPQHRLSEYSLLRGAPLRVALRGRGRIFENSEGRAETYDLSSQVDHIDTFVSHTHSQVAEVHGSVSALRLFSFLRVLVARRLCHLHTGRSADVVLCGIGIHRWAA